jgi:flagellar protein FlaF
MSYQTYQRTAQQAESPRELEYRLFGDVTRALMEAAKLPETDFGGRMEALDWNRRVWSALATDCTLDSNGLPRQVRAHIISLSLWVGRHTTAIMRREEDFQPLIDVNRLIMQGLQAQPIAA